MTTLTLILAAATMLVLAVAMAAVLGWANRAFHVEVNPLVQQAIEILPGVNCGGCGYVGCSEYAEAVVAGKAPVDACAPGGPACARALATLLGIELDESAPYRAVVHCGATGDQRHDRREYRGEPTCAAANFVGGIQGCAYGCLAFGDCERSCPFDAIHVIDGLATVDYEKCTGCGACERACPRHIITMAPFKQERIPAIACSNQDPGKLVRAVCDVGCIGCGLCAKVGGGLFAVRDNLSRIDYETFEPASDVSTAVSKCPRKIIRYFGRETVDEPTHPSVMQPKPETTVDNIEYRDGV
jgi:Na+-translocating ferredoxin:NAD+ oxidoreductase RNF subunit RnfB